ncbi:MAG: endonuclease [Saprospiraceae bacterium]|nr:endonuclease [Saprospiraceae bacterium]
MANKEQDSPAHTQSCIRLLVRGRAFLFILLFVSASLSAQYKYEAVFPNLREQDLYEAVRLGYTPDTLLDYGVARDTLFLRIDAVDRFLSCIYTGMTLYIPEGQDPTQAVFLNGIADGINTEHVYPQGFGLNDQPAQGDMHNLFPARIKTNSDRANRPFGESPDPSTERWYLDKMEMANKPATMIDAYSELGSAGQFEPRER